MSPLGAKNLVNSEKEKRIEINKSVLIGNKTLFVAIKWTLLPEFIAKQ